MNSELRDEINKALLNQEKKHGWPTYKITFKNDPPVLKINSRITPIFAYIDPKKLSASQMLKEYQSTTPSIVFKVAYTMDVEADFPRKQDTYQTDGKFLLPIPVDCEPDETNERRITMNNTAFQIFCPGNGFGTSQMVTSFLEKDSRPDVKYPALSDFFEGSTEKELVFDTEDFDTYDAHPAFLEESDAEDDEMLDMPADFLFGASDSL